MNKHRRIAFVIIVALCAIVIAGCASGWTRPKTDEERLREFVSQLDPDSNGVVEFEPYKLVSWTSAESLSYTAIPDYQQGFRLDIVDPTRFDLLESRLRVESSMTPFMLHIPSGSGVGCPDQGCNRVTLVGDAITAGVYFIEAPEGAKVEYSFSLGGDGSQEEFPLAGYLSAHSSDYHTLLR